MIDLLSFRYMAKGFDKMSAFGEASSKNERLSFWLTRYAQTHRNPINIKIHFVCVPLIFFSIIALLDAVNILELSPGLPMTGAWVLIGLSMLFYLKVSLKYAITMFLLATSCLFLSRFLLRVFESSFLAIVGLIFILAWIGQFVGHKIEGAKPAFFEDILFLLIGPLWIAEKLTVGDRNVKNGSANS